MLIAQYRTLIVTLILVLPLLTTQCVFKTSVEPTELEGGQTLQGYYTAAELDSGRIYHNREDTIFITLKGLFIYSNCSLGDNDIVRESATTSDSIFQIRYRVDLETPDDLSCANSTGTADTTLPLEKIWGDDIKQLKIYKYDTLPFDSTPEKVLDSIFIRNGSYKRDTIIFEFDSIFGFATDDSLHFKYAHSRNPEETGSDSLIPKISNGTLVEYTYQPFTIKEDTVDYFWSRCDDPTAVRECETIPTYIRKSHTEVLGDTTYPLKNVTNELHQYMCIDSITGKLELDENDETYSICRDAHLIDTTQTSNLTLADTANASNVIVFYEQCIKEEEIICTTLDTITFKSPPIPDTAITVSLTQDSIVITEKLGCMDGQTYCTGETSNYHSILDTVVPDTIFYQSVAYLQELNSCDSIDTFKVNTFKYKARGAVTITMELFTIDSLFCDDPTKIDTLIWDIDHFNKLIDTSSVNEVDSVTSYNLFEIINTELDQP